MKVRFEEKLEFIYQIEQDPREKTIFWVSAHLSNEKKNVIMKIDLKNIIIEIFRK
jgi:hypothetical protein